MATSEGGHYPRNPSEASELQGALGARTVDRAYLAHLALTAAQAVAASTTGVKSAVTDNGSQQTITTGITNPPFPRNITATAGGTAGDIKAVAVTIHGLNDAGEVIQETLPAFTADTAGTVVGSKAFKTVTSIVIPAHDGTGATTAIGFGDKIGLPHELAHNTVQQAFVNNVEEFDAPTVTIHATALESNTVLLDTALAGTPVDLYYYV